MFFSIIIPVYNSEKWLNECLDSVCKSAEKLQSAVLKKNCGSQPVKSVEVEVICVNDGSIDDSRKILEYYAQEKKIPFFRMIHQVNAGVSAARNTALDIATGEWIIFLDSDDWISKDYLQKSFICIQQNPGMDIIAATVEQFIDGKEYINSRCGLSKKFFEGDLLAQTHRNEYMSLRSSFCDLVIKRKIIQDHSIRFPGTMRIGEDSLFAETVFAYSSKMIFAPEIRSYYYRRNSDSTSLSHKVNEEDIKASIYRVIENIRLFKEIGSWGTRLNACHCALGIIFAIKSEYINDKSDFITWLVNNEDFQSYVLPFLCKYAVNLKSKIFACVLRLLPHRGQKAAIKLLTRI